MPTSMRLAGAAVQSSGDVNLSGQESGKQVGCQSCRGFLNLTHISKNNCQAPVFSYIDGGFGRSEEEGNLRASYDSFQIHL